MKKGEITYYAVILITALMFISILIGYLTFMKPGVSDGVIVGFVKILGKIGSVL